MAPWVNTVFIRILPKILCIERPKKNEQPDDEAVEVLTDAFHVPPDVDKFVDYDNKQYIGDYGIPGEFFFFSKIYIKYKFSSPYLLLHRTTLCIQNTNHI